MSRTYKDKPYEIKFPETKFFLGRWGYWFNRPERGALTKKKRNLDQGDEYGLGSTPSWWTNMTMTKRRRRENRVYESILKQVDLKYIEDYEPFLNWKRPHIYYW